MPARSSRSTTPDLILFQTDLSAEGPPEGKAAVIESVLETIGEFLKDHEVQLLDGSRKPASELFTARPELDGDTLKFFLVAERSRFFAALEPARETMRQNAMQILETYSVRPPSNKARMILMASLVLSRVLPKESRDEMRQGQFEGQVAIFSIRVAIGLHQAWTNNPWEARADQRAQAAFENESLAAQIEEKRAKIKSGAIKPRMA